MFSKELKQKANHLFEQYPRKVNALLPLLHMVQKETGCISEPSMKEVAKMCDISVTHVQGVVTFYTMFSEKPYGKHHVSVCTNLSCWIKGGNQILQQISKNLNIHPGETTPDGDFTLEEVECLGACSYAPALIIDEKYYENMTTEKIDQILSDIKLND